MLWDRHKNDYGLEPGRETSQFFLFLFLLKLKKNLLKKPFFRHANYTKLGGNMEGEK